MNFHYVFKLVLDVCRVVWSYV